MGIINLVGGKGSLKDKMKREGGREYNLHFFALSALAKYCNFFYVFFFFFFASGCSFGEKVGRWEGRKAYLLLFRRVLEAFIL